MGVALIPMTHWADVSLGCSPRRKKMEKKRHLIAQAWFSLMLPFSLHPGHRKVSSAASLWPGGCHDALCSPGSKKRKQTKRLNSLNNHFLLQSVPSWHLSQWRHIWLMLSHVTFTHVTTAMEPHLQVQVSMHLHCWLNQFCNDIVSFLRLRSSTTCSSMVLGILSGGKKTWWLINF